MIYCFTETMKRRIILSVTNDLVTDQRVHRACTALHEAGYDVTLIGRRLPESAALKRDYKTVRMRLLFRKKAVFYAEYNLRLFLRLLWMRADLLYANDTDTLPANYWAARLRRKHLFFDAHELFPEVPELVGRPRVKAFWTAIEDHILPKIDSLKPKAHAVTVCQSIADTYRERYGIRMDVVRNVPLHYDNVVADEALWRDKLPQGKRILLYQGAVNVGRGIEWVIDAMPLLPECHLVVAGVGDVYDTLRARVREKRCHQVTFLGRVEPRQLHGLTPLADLGLSLLENRGLNYYFSLPNRIADFVQAEVPVLATDFPEIRRVVEGYHIGTLVPAVPFDKESNTSLPPDPQALATTIRNALAYWDHLDPDERHRRFASAQQDLCWQNDKKTLLAAIDTIFA